MRALAVLLLLTCSSLNAATWYASATGNSTNGTRSLPWGPQYATTNSNPHLAAGDTVLFIPGVYTCVETNNLAGYDLHQILTFRKSGTPSAKITYQSESLWDFRFDGGLLCPATVSNLVIRNFWIMFSGITGRFGTNGVGNPGGINTLANGVDLMHNLIENVGHPGIASWAPTRGKYIAGNVVRFVGVDEWGAGSAGAPEGSGMYMQNAYNSSEALIEGNIVYFNYTFGMKAWGGTDIWGFNFNKNVVAANQISGIFHNVDDEPSQGVRVTTNFTWGNGLQIGHTYGDGSHSNAVVLGNYVVAKGHDFHPFHQVDGWSRNTYSNNLAVTLSNRYVWFMEEAGEATGDIASHHIDFNTYYGTNYGDFGSSTTPFIINEVVKTMDQWRAAIHGDTNSTYTYGTPATNSTYVFRPSTDTNFVHVVVYNWTNATTATVNLSSYFSAGAQLAIYDAQNIPVAYTTNAFSGSTVSLNLTLTNRATMLGVFTHDYAPWAGFDSRFRTFVVYQTSSAGLPGATVNVGTLYVR